MANTEAKNNLKEPWQMTQEEFQSLGRARNNTGLYPAPYMLDGAVAQVGDTVYRNVAGLGLFTPGKVKILAIQQNAEHGNWEVKLDDGTTQAAELVWKTSDDVFQYYYASPHSNAVRRALSEGKPVPPEVLADYPHLAAEYANQTNQDTPVSAQA